MNYKLDRNTFSGAFSVHEQCYSKMICAAFVHPLFLLLLNICFLLDSQRRGILQLVSEMQMYTTFSTVNRLWHIQTVLSLRKVDSLVLA